MELKSVTVDNVVVDVNGDAMRTTPKPLAEVEEVWHKGRPEHEGGYLVLYNGKHRFADYKDGEFAVHTYTVTSRVKEVEKWCFVRRGQIGYGED